MVDGVVSGWTKDDVVGRSAADVSLFPESATAWQVRVQFSLC